MILLNTGDYCCPLKQWMPLMVKGSIAKGIAMMSEVLVCWLDNVLPVKQVIVIL